VPALAAKLSGRRLTVFHGRFTDVPGYDESYYARALANSIDADLRIDGDFEPGQKAHPQKTVDTVTKSGLVIVLNHNRHVLGLQRAKLDRRGSSQLPVGNAIRSMQSNGAPLIDDDRGFLGKSPFESYERCASIEDKNAPSAIDRDL
jgi:hypothetical protein